jgi:CheY-like chemotaxis protein
VSSSTIPYVFVVDDEPVIASTVAAIIRLHGYSAKSFTSPLEALDAVRARAPDLLISDVAMPLISGVDLAIQMRKLCPICKILLFSGQTPTCDLLKSARSRGHTFDLLLKPLPPTELLFEVERMVNGIAAIHAVSGETLSLEWPGWSLADGAACPVIGVQ